MPANTAFAAGTAPLLRNEPPKPKRIGRLDSATAVRREAARLYRDGRNGVVDPGDASKLASILTLIGRLIEVSDIERRVAELEGRLR